MIQRKSTCQKCRLACWGSRARRLPRIMGAENALRLTLPGNTSMPQLRSSGVVATLPAASAGRSHHLTTKADARIPSSSLPASPASQHQTLVLRFFPWRALMGKRRPGQPAPQAIIRCVEAACSGPTFRDGAVKRVSLPSSCLLPSQKRCDTCFSQGAAARVPESGSEQAPRRRCGRWTDGRGHSHVLCNAGMKCYVLDVDQASLDRHGAGPLQLQRSRSLTPTQKANAGQSLPHDIVR